MQEKAKSFSEDPNAIKKAIEDTLEHLDVLQKQSLNLFDKPEVYTRAFQLLDILDEKILALNHCVPSHPDTDRIVQDLLFRIKKMRTAVENLKLNCHTFAFQQAFIEEFDPIKENLNTLII